MTKNDNNQDLRNFESLQIKLASTEKMLEWSHGEVTKPETTELSSLKETDSSARRFSDLLRIGCAPVENTIKFALRASFALTAELK